MSAPLDVSPGVFKGMSFLVDLVGLDDMPQLELNRQISEDIIANGGHVSDNENPLAISELLASQQITHVVARHCKQPSAVAGKASGKVLVSEFWIRARMRFAHPPEVMQEIFWQPAPCAGSPPGSEDLLICITGYTGMERKMLAFACQWIGFAFEAQLSRSSTHLLCFQHKGAKWEAANRWGQESRDSGGPGTPFVVNHRWLVDCLTAWDVLPPGKYAEHSGEALMLNPGLLPPSWEEVHGHASQMQPPAPEHEHGDPASGSGSATDGQAEEGKENSPPDEAEAAPAAATASKGSGARSGGAEGLSQGSHGAVSAAPNPQHAPTLAPGMAPPATPASALSSLPSLPSTAPRSGTARRSSVAAVLPPSHSGRRGSMQAPELPTSSLKGLSNAAPKSAARFATPATSSGVPKGTPATEVVERPGMAAQAAARASTGQRRRTLASGATPRRYASAQTPPPPAPAFGSPEVTGLAIGSASVPRTKPADQAGMSSGARNALRASRTSSGGAAKDSGRKVTELKDDAPEERDSALQDDMLGVDGTFGAPEEDSEGEREPSTGVQRKKQPDLPKQAGRAQKSKQRDRRRDTSKTPQGLAGRRFAKRFGGKQYCGTVESWDPDSGHYFVKYDDGDAEDLSEAELEMLLLPEGALPACKRQKSTAAESLTPSGNQARQVNRRASGVVDRAVEDDHGDEIDGKAEEESVCKSAKAPARPIANCLALTGFHTEPKRHFTDAIHRLGAAKSRKSDLHAWDDEVTHLVMPELKRCEKTVAAMAAGVWLLTSEFLDCSLVEGELLPEEEFEVEACGKGFGKNPPISEGAPRHWRLRRDAFGIRAFEGLRVVLYGKLEGPSADTITRIIEAGGGIVLKRSQPYTKALNEGVDLAVVQRSKAENDRWIQAFLRNGIMIVSLEYVIDWVSHPSSCLDAHCLFGSQSGVHLAMKEKNRSECPRPVERGLS